MSQMWSQSLVFYRINGTDTNTRDALMKCLESLTLSLRNQTLLRNNLLINLNIPSQVPEV